VLNHDLFLILSRIGAGFGAAFFFWGLWYVSKGRWIGFGDAKLALPLGMLVGIGDVFSMVVFSFWIGAGVSLVLLGIQKLLKRGKTSLRFLSTPITMKSEVPFAPFLILGFIAVHFLHADIFDITYTFLFS
jgi:prepilin signal peptidase PulO-like enzyme (type II secretory pathway)